jgi:hypothetical protein
MSFETILDRHNDHEVVILPRYHKNRPQLVPGLYCVNCFKLIKWLNPQQAQELEQLGVEVLDPSKLDKIRVSLTAYN